MIKAFLFTVARNLGGMLLTKGFLIWLLRRAAKQTGNLIDDNLVDLVDAAHANDVAGVKAAITAIQNEYNENK